MSKKQSLRFRLIAYPILAAFFAVVAYFIATSAMGYRFQYQNGKLSKEKTGAIILSSRPGDAVIFLNDRKYESKTPMFPFLTVQIGGLKPADYNIKLTKSGYETWDGVFRVYSGMVSWGTQILMLPEKREAVGYKLTTPVESQIVSTDKTKIMLVTHDTQNQAIATWQINAVNKNKTLLFEKRLAADEKYIPLFFSPDNQRVLFEHQQGANKKYVVIEVTQSPQEWDVTETFKNSFDTYQFNPRNHDEILAVRAGDLFRLDYAKKTMSGVLYSGVLGTYLENQNVLFVQKGDKYTSLNRLNQNNSKELIIRDLPVSTGYQVSYLTADFGYAIVAGETKDLLLYRPNGNPDITPKKVDTGVEYLLPSPKFQFLGYGKAGSFHTYELDKSRGYIAFENRKISSIAWFNDQYNLAYIENGKLKMVTYNGFYDKNIFDASDSFPVFTSPEGPRLYFTAQNKDKNIPDVFVYDFN